MRRLCFIIAALFIATLANPHAAIAGCASTLLKAKRVANDISVKFSIPQVVHAGSSFAVEWRRKSRGRLDVPTYLVVATPADVRFKGRGFLALTAGGRAPNGISFRRDHARVFVPLYRITDTATSGKIRITSYRAGLQQLNWAVIAGGACGEHTLASGRQKVEVVPGAAKLVFQDRFSIASPKKRIRTQAGDYEVLIYGDHYEVIDKKTGGLILSEPGSDPNFSPSGRFLAARQPNSLFQIFDLVSGTEVAHDFGNEVLAWVRNDSYVIASWLQWGSATIKNTVVDGGDVISAGAGPHCCGAWSSSQVIFDLDRGFAAIKGDQSLTIQDLAAPRKFEDLNSRSLDSKAYFAAIGANYVRRIYDPVYRGMPSIWSLGEPLTLSHIEPSGPDRAVQARFLAKSQRVSSRTQASRRRSSHGSLIGRTVVPQFKVSDGSVFAALAGAGIKTGNLIPVKRVFGRKEVESTEKPDALLASLFKHVPATRKMFHKVASLCGADGGPEEFDPEWVSQAYRWNDKGRKVWLVQGVCYAGSGAFVNAARLVLIKEGQLQQSIRSIVPLLGKDALGGTMAIDGLLRVRTFVQDNGNVVLALPATNVAIVVDVDRALRIGGIIRIKDATLISDMRETPDGRYLVQHNHDGRIFVYRISDGVRMLQGAYIDDELIVATDDGRYDTTYEGAYSVQVKFAGIRGLFTFDQFAPILRRPGLAKAVLEGKTVRPRAKMLPEPPTVSLSLAANAKNGHRQGKVVAAAQQNLQAVRIFVDGELVKELPAGSAQVELPIDIVDPGGGRWVSAVAVDSRGLISRPSQIRLPGKPRPEGIARAVVIGINKYNFDGVQDLDSAESDAQAFAGALKSSEGRRFKSVRTTVMLGAQVSPDAMLGALRKAVEDTKRDDTLILYFAGHGANGASSEFKQPEAGFVVAMPNIRPDDLKDTALSWKALSTVLSKSRGAVIVVLDACNAGASGNESLMTNDDAVSTLYTKGGAPMIILAASKGRQESQERPGEGGLFTHAIVSAISRERLRHDLNHSGLIDLNELYAAVKRQVMAETKGQQTPWLARNGLVGEMSIF